MSRSTLPNRLTSEKDWGAQNGQRDGSRRSAAPAIRPAIPSPARRSVLDPRPLDLVRGKPISLSRFSPLIPGADGMARREYSLPNSVYVSLRTCDSGNASRLPVEFRGGSIASDRARDRGVKGCCTHTHEDVWCCLGWNGQGLYTRCV